MIRFVCAHTSNKHHHHFILLDTLEVYSSRFKYTFYYIMLKLHLIIFIIAQLLDFNLDKKKSFRRAQFTYIYSYMYVPWYVLDQSALIHWEEVRIVKKKTCLQGELYLVHHQLCSVYNSRCGIIMKYFQIKKMKHSIKHNGLGIRRTLRKLERTPITCFSLQ